MFCFQSLLWKFSLKLCFRLLFTRSWLRLRARRTDSGRSYQSKTQTTLKALKAADNLGGLFIWVSPMLDNFAPSLRRHSLGRPVRRTVSMQIEIRDAELEARIRKQLQSRDAGSVEEAWRRLL